MPLPMIPRGSTPDGVDNGDHTIPWTRDADVDVRPCSGSGASGSGSKASLCSFEVSVGSVDAFFVRLRDVPARNCCNG